MKTFLWFFVVVLLPTAVFARDLHALAKRELARRAQLKSRGQTAHLYSDQDLNRHGGGAISSNPASGSSASGITAERRRSAKDRELEQKERAEAERYWRQERRRHDREQERLAAKIRRLEWRYQERLNRLNPVPHRRRLDEDPTLALLGSSLDALREDFRHKEEAFLERGRRAGAMPGWLR